MGRSGDGNHDNGSQSGSSCQFERLRLEPVYDTFMCPLTKKIMVKHLTARRLRIGSRSAESAEVRCKTLETLRIAVEEDSYLKTMMVERDTVRTIVKLLSHEQSKEWDEAISLMYELSKSEASSKKISAGRNVQQQMAENGRLGPLLTQLLEGSQEIKLSMASFLASSP
ncbi:hypothetical protein MLD38_001850 [Melastoma candidum]|uniref:Uncharacterized protein n=1 Tax=Melastoma candidum TaxID=119954 RepID=A0ACB9SFI9_9MYRT|nr:hypothetical protein MLD38_001850 [Melastoma candidum]